MGYMEGALIYCSSINAYEIVNLCFKVYFQLFRNMNNILKRKTGKLNSYEITTILYGSEFQKYKREDLKQERCGSIQ